MDQTELFPKTEVDKACEVLSHLEVLLEKRSDALNKASDKYIEMELLVKKQRSVVDMLRAGLELKHDSDWLRSAGIDPETGEVNE